MVHLKLFFDLDGTLAGYSEWKSLFWNTLQLFKTGLLYKPPTNYEWNILTSRPKIDRPIINYFCTKYKLYPTKIITTSTLFYGFKSKSSVCDWKMQILNNELNNRIRYEKTALLYIDNDLEILNQMVSIPGLFLLTTDALPNILNHNNNQLEKIFNA